METVTDEVYIGSSWLLKTDDDGSLAVKYYRKETDSYTTIQSFHPPVAPATASPAPAPEKEE